MLPPSWPGHAHECHLSQTKETCGLLSLSLALPHGSYWNFYIRLSPCVHSSLAAIFKSGFICLRSTKLLKRLTSRTLLCRYKWGLQKDKPPHSCEIEVEGPDGIKVPRQEPFETLDELYVPLSRTSATDLEDTPGQEPGTAAKRRRLHTY